jgi:hypothetical protein
VSAPVRTTGVDCPYAGPSPYSNQVSAAKPFGTTTPPSRADCAVTASARLVVAFAPDAAVVNVWSPETVRPAGVVTTRR